MISGNFFKQLEIFKIFDPVSEINQPHRSRQPFVRGGVELSIRSVLISIIRPILAIFKSGIAMKAFYKGLDQITDYGRED